MKDTLTIIKKEWRSFFGSEKGVFAVHGILIFVWSFIPLSSGSGSVLSGNPLWWLFFSVIVSGSFANSVFVAERLSGSMEILLTSGFPRNSVLMGKTGFVILMAVVIGGLSFALSFLWASLISKQCLFQTDSLLFGALLYCAGTFMNAAAGAWMSIRLSSPRLLPFVNLLFVGLVCGIYYALRYAAGVPGWPLFLFLAAAGIAFLLLAKKDFNGEKIIAPLDL